MSQAYSGPSRSWSSGGRSRTRAEGQRHKRDVLGAGQALGTEGTWRSGWHRPWGRLHLVPGLEGATSSARGVSQGWRQASREARAVGVRQAVRPGPWVSAVAPGGEEGRG